MFHHFMSRLLPAGAALAAACAVEAATIERIVVRSAVPGAVISPEQVGNCVASVQGGVFDQAILDADIKRLMASGLYADTQASVRPLEGDRVEIVFTLKPQPTVREVAITGNQLIAGKKLQGLLGQQPRRFLDPKAVAADVAALRKHYFASGYHGTTVEALTTPVAGTNEVTVTYAIHEEMRHKVRKVRVTGNAAIPEKELRKKLETKFSVWSLLFPANFSDPEKERRDRDALYEAYHDRGHFDFAITGERHELSANGKWVTWAIAVAEGPRYQVGEISVTGNSAFTAADLLAAAPGEAALVTGQPFDGAALRAMAERIRNRYDAKGYIDLRVQPRRLYDSKAQTVAIRFELSEGKPATIRDIAIVGNEVTQDKVIRRELTILPEDLADGRKLRESKSRLMNLNYFESLDILPQATDREGQKDLQVLLKEKRTGQLMFGVGFSTDDDVFGVVEVSQSNFDLANPPRFTGGGQRLKLRAEAGTQHTGFQLSFTEPWLLDQRLRLDTELFHRGRSWEYYDETDTGAQVMLTRDLRPGAPAGSEWQHWRQSFGLRAEHVALDNFDDDVDPFLQEQEGGYDSVSLIYRISRDTRDSFIHTTSGSRLQFTAEYTPEWLGGYDDNYRLHLQGSKYIPLKKCVLRLEAEAGTVDGNNIALFDRYFAGGANSIRGFERRMVGPVDSRDNPYGGQSLLRGTAELTYPIYQMIRGAVFTDFGNVWEDAYGWDPADVAVSVGLGFQIDMPFGPIRLDYGVPMNQPWDHLGGGGRLHFSMGYFF
ncbi:MAG: outer membrane protein assembly factor BamA [Lentisphaeria bacterium]|jgi:outer membrane protein insertion porin family